MVDVTGKTETVRVARAEAFVEMSAETVRRLREKTTPKGDPLEVARIAASVDDDTVAWAYRTRRRRVRLDRDGELHSTRGDRNVLGGELRRAQHLARSDTDGHAMPDQLLRGAGGIRHAGHTVRHTDMNRRDIASLHDGARG